MPRKYPISYLNEIDFNPCKSTWRRLSRKTSCSTAYEVGSIGFEVRIGLSTALHFKHCFGAPFRLTAPACLLDKLLDLTREVLFSREFVADRSVVLTALPLLQWCSLIRGTLVLEVMTRELLFSQPTVRKPSVLR